jgi:acetyl esterase/lipase
MLHDTFTTLNWLKHNAHEHGGDTNFIAISGGSSGGHLASLAALIGGNPDRPKEFRYADIALKTAISIYGRYDFLDQANVWDRMKPGLIRFFQLKIMPCSPEEDPKIWKLASPTSMISKYAPPFLVVHGTHDSLIPIEETRYFVKQLKCASKNNTGYVELKGAQHAFDILSTPVTEGFALRSATFLEITHHNYYASKTSHNQ